MGKRLWRKHSYGGNEDENPGCIWAFFRILSYHNVKRMLPDNHKKQKPPRSGTQTKRKVKPKNHQICPPYDLEDDAMNMNSASIRILDQVNSGKKSVKAKIKTILLADEDDSKELDLLQQSQLKVLEHNCKHLSAPTLFSLLKANPKPTSTPKPAEESINLRPKTRVEKEPEAEQVGVFEVFKVNQDLFLNVLKDSPPKKPRLAKSRTYPSPNRSLTMAPSKVEHKHNEIWPESANGNDLKKSKSQRVGRSSSVIESLDRFAPLFDAKSDKENIKKGLSRSLKLTNEKEFTLVGNHHLRKSSREKLSVLEIESYSDSLQANLEEMNGLKESKVDSLRDFISLNQVNGGTISHLHEKSNRREEEQIANATSIAEVHNQQITVHSPGCEVPKDLPVLVSHSRHTSEDLENTQEYYNEEFQYVKYVLDLMGFTTGEDPFGAWRSPDEPLDPALFDGIEVCCPFEPKSSKKEAACISSHDRKVLFDLINEALVYVHERSYVCYPKALSYSCHVCPKPKGKNQVVEEVWEFMRQYLERRPEPDQALNLAVPLHLCEEPTGWMNLQADSECLALFLEDLIFDELLDEIVYC